MAKYFKDTDQSSCYSKFRFSSPQCLIDKIIEYLANGENDVNKWPLAVDVGCGPGMSTRLLAPYFEKVYGFDYSDTQINEAVKSTPETNIEYQVASAECLPLENNSVDLVNTSSAVHWFQVEKFFDEVKRVLKPNGVIVVSSYRFPFVYLKNNREEMRLKNVIREFGTSPLIAPYKPKQLNMAINGYQDLVLPFEDTIRIDGFPCTKTVTLRDMIGFLKSLTTFTLLKKERPKDAETVLEQFVSKITEVVGDCDSTEFDFEYEFILIMGRKK